MLVGEALLDSHRCGVAMASSRMDQAPAHPVLQSLALDIHRPANESKFHSRDTKWILKLVLPKGE